MVTYKKGMVATIGTPGMKISQYQVTSNLGTDAGLTIRAKDVGLSTIYSMQAQEVHGDTAQVREYTIGIGTFTHGKGNGNFATIRPHSVGGTTTLILGTTLQVTAIGM